MAPFATKFVTRKRAGHRNASVYQQLLGIEWCGWRDLNPHALRRQNLNSANTPEEQSVKKNISQDKPGTNPESAKLEFPPSDVENPAALAGATGRKACQRLVGKPYIWGSALASLKLEDSLWLKPKGWSRIDLLATPITITVYHPDEPEQVFICVSPGHANRLRQDLSDAGMCGLIEGAL